MDPETRPNPGAAPAGRRGGRRPPVRAVRQRHDLPRRHPRPARRPRATARAADALPHRARHGLERGLRAGGHGEPPNHARRCLERRDVRRVPRPQAARRPGRASHPLGRAALGLRRGAARAVRRASRDGAGGARPDTRGHGPGGVRGGRRRMARRWPAAACRHLGRRRHGRDRAAGPGLRHRPRGVVPAALLRIAVRRDAGVRADRRRGVDRSARPRPGPGRIGVERGGRRERGDGRSLEPDRERAGGDAVAEYRAAAARPAPRVARRRDELHLRGQPAPDRLHGEPDRCGASGDTGRADRLVGGRAGGSPRRPVAPRLGSRGDRDDRLSGPTRARGAHATEWRTFHAGVTTARRPGRAGRHAERNLPVKRPDPFREISVMDKLPRAVLLTAALLVAACQDTSTPFQPGGPPAAIGLPGLPGASATRYIVVFNDGVSDPIGLAQTLVATYNGSLLHTYTAALKGFAATLPDAAVPLLRLEPLVAYVEPDQTIRADGTENMDANGDPWGLDRIDQQALPLSGTYTYTSDGAGVHAYIIDTGIWTLHPDFGGRADNVYDALTLNLVAIGEDCNSHRTHVAGTVGGVTYGVAKGVSLHGVRVLGCAGVGFTSDVIAGVDWVTANHQSPAVANMSLGGGSSAALNTAVTNLSNSGVFPAATAGNDNADACNSSPAGASGVFTVAAAEKTDAKASYSHWGTCG